MKLHSIAALLTIFAGLSPNAAHSKVVDYTRQDVNELRNTDSFSVECESDRGVIGRVGVDVDAATITIEVPGEAPAVHPITKFSMWSGDTPDRFGRTHMHLMYVFWGSGPDMQGVVRATDKVVGSRWEYLPGDTTVWSCDPAPQ